MATMTGQGATGEFVERLLEVITSGRRTATYKLAVLLALVDLCASRSDEAGKAPQVLHTRDIAEQVAALYWRQVATYPVELRQIRAPRAAIIETVRTFRYASATKGATSLRVARQVNPSGYERMVDGVEVTVAAQPIPRLQSVGSSDMVFPFIFEISWGAREAFTVARLRRAGPRGPEVRLRKGAGDELVRLAPLVRPLVELHWTRMVADLSGVAQQEIELQHFLFGSDRVVLPPSIRAEMARWQGGRCFYCAAGLGAKVEADHVVPRSRGGRDAVQNLVLADRRCNNDKRAVLPAPPHVGRWAARNRERGPDLEVAAREIRWESDPVGVPAVARAVYAHLPSGPTPMWWGVGDVAPGQASDALAALGGIRRRTCVVRT